MKKRIFTAIVAMLAVAGAVNAQSDYQMNVITSDGQALAFDANNLISVTFSKKPVAVEAKSGADLAEVWAAVDKENVPSVTIKLEKDGEYTVSAPIVTAIPLTIEGNGAKITATTNIVELEAAPEGVVGYINDITFKDAFISCSKSLFYSQGKGNLIFNLNVINCILAQVADATTVDFTKGSAVANFNILNSTVYAATATTKAFFSSQSGQRLTELNADGIQKFDFENSTFYNLAKSKNFFTHRQNNQKWLAYTVKNNIFVNCGKSGQVIKGMNGGQSGKNPIWDIDGNLFNFDGDDGVRTDTNEAESTGDDDEPIKNSVAGVVAFEDADNGNFKQSAFEIGDPRWF